jgi:hypothetical protein
MLKHKESMMLNYTVQELALQFAEATVEFHEALQSTWVDKDQAVDVARHCMLELQDQLYNAARRQVELEKLAEGVQ